MERVVPQPYRLTWRDWARAAPESQRLELIEGELYGSPAPTLEHQRLVGRLHFSLFGFLEATELGEVFQAPTGVRLTHEDVVEPDVVVVLRTARVKLSGVAIVGTPSLVVEVLSPGTARRDLIEKRALYARVGVPEYWIVDPAQRSVELLRLQRGRWRHTRLTHATESLHSPLLPGFELTLKALFR